MADELEQVVAGVLRGIPGLPRPCPHAEGRAVIAALSQAGYSIIRTAEIECLREAADAGLSACSRSESGGYSVGALKEAIVHFTELGGVLGANLSESKQVFLRVHGHEFRLSRVGVSVHEGVFVLILNGDTDA